MINAIDGRIIEKKSMIPGVVPTVAPSFDHTDGTWSTTDIYNGEFFVNIPDEKVFMRCGSSIVEISPVTPTAVGLDDVLAIDNTTGANNIQVNNNQFIKYVTQPDTQVGFDDLTVITKKFVDDSIAALASFQYVTYSQLTTLLSNSDLIPNQNYFITDRGDQGIILTALKNNLLSINGLRIMNCPVTYNVVGSFKGIWKATGTYAPFNKVIWGGKVWGNISGLAGTALSDSALDSNWTLIDKPTYGLSDVNYIEKVFYIEYDLVNDWIYYQEDDKNNKIGFIYNIAFPVNPIDLTDWNNPNIFNNQCNGIYNNSNGGAIYNNTNLGLIYNNTKGGTIYNNVNAGDIKNNSNLGVIFFNSNYGDISDNEAPLNNIQVNSCKGGINDNSIDGNIVLNTNNGSIFLNFNTSGTCDIMNNNNNGNISGPRTGDVLGTITNI